MAAVEKLSWSPGGKEEAGEGKFSSDWDDFGSDDDDDNHGDHDDSNNHNADAGASDDHEQQGYDSKETIAAAAAAIATPVLASRRPPLSEGGKWSIGGGGGGISTPRVLLTTMNKGSSNNNNSSTPLPFSASIGSPLPDTAGDGTFEEIMRERNRVSRITVSRLTDSIRVGGCNWIKAIDTLCLVDANFACLWCRKKHLTVVVCYCCCC